MNEIEVEPKQDATKYEIVIDTGHDAKASIASALRAGFALSYPGESHYVLKLSMFPFQRYYLTKNRASDTEYTIFSRRVLDAGARGGVRFQNPVGSGRLTDEAKDYLEIRFPLLSGRLFMNLFPKN